MFRLLLIFCLFSFFTIFATEYEYPTLMNPDGTIQSRDYNKEQRITFESIKKDVTYFQTEIGKILPYLIRNGKVKNNSYTKEVRNFIETQPGSRNQHFVSETFVLNVNNGKLNSISFLRRRTRLNPKMETETIIRTISNEVTNEELSSVKLQIDTHTNYTDPKMPIKKIIPMTFIPSPMAE